ncbi:hypothetical protein GCM10009720_12410 [Yaniella flava]|uniref:PucR C-terminal helix-turn-helix domain-containing protein n=1 Tax=Yaniella flava TaxID=287930 RepID=A0ABN2UD00_9MICC
MAITIESVLTYFQGRAITNVTNLNQRVAEIVRIEDLRVHGYSSHATLVSCSEADLMGFEENSSQFLSLLRGCVLLVEPTSFDAARTLDEAGFTYILGPAKIEHDVTDMLSMVITANFAYEDRLVTSAMRGLTLVARTGGIQGVLSDLSRFIDGWAVLLDTHGQVIESVGAARLHIEDAISVVLNRPVRIRYPDLQVHLVGTDSSGEQTARLVIAARSQSAYRTRSIAAHAAALLAFMMGTTKVSETERLGRKLMLDTLLDQNKEAENYLKQWKINVKKLSAFVVSSKTRNIDTERLVSFWLRRLGANPLYFGHVGEAYGFVQGSALSKLIALAEDFRTNRGERVVLGVGDELEVSMLGRALHQARQAHDVAKRMKKTAVHFSDLLSIRKGLVTLSDEQRANFATLLDPLVLSEPNSQEMIRTLRVYLAHNGSWKPAASELEIHRQTLMNRIQRIQTTLNLNVDDPDDRALLWFGLRAKDMQ